MLASIIVHQDLGVYVFIFSLPFLENFLGCSSKLHWAFFSSLISFVQINSSNESLRVAFFSKLKAIHSDENVIFMLFDDWKILIQNCTLCIVSQSILFVYHIWLVPVGDMCDATYSRSAWTYK